MSRVLIVKVGETVAPLVPRRGDFDAWFADGLGLDDEDVQVVRPHRGEALPDPRSFAGVVVTGSSAMVTARAEWSTRTERWILSVVDRGVPFLGVCYGHQLLGTAFGGEVDWAPRGREIGTVEVGLRAEASDDPLFGGLAPSLTVQTTHSQSVVRLPDGARHLAENAHDPYQAFAVGERTWGVQFHPEFDADIVRGYLEARRAELEKEGLDVDVIAAETRDAPDGREILRRFRELAGR